MEPVSKQIRLLGHFVHYTEWGHRAAPSVVMWHGLARTGRDFDELAAALSADFHVLCPDMIGRGRSTWSSTPASEYRLGHYARIAGALADALWLGRFAWVGTSMGGAAGIAAGAGVLRGRITRLVVNDIGPTLPNAAVERIRAYVGHPPDFATEAELEAYFRTIYQPFGPLTDVQWRRMTEVGMRRLPNGRVTPHYDPAIARPFDTDAADFEQWDAYDKLAMPVLVLRGAESDLLLPEIAAEMARRGPGAKVVEISGCGHAPALNVPDQIEIVRRFLAAEEA